MLRDIGEYTAVFFIKYLFKNGLGLHVSLQTTVSPLPTRKQQNIV